MAGLEAARARGRKGGRKPVMDEKKIALASKLMRDRETPISEVCEAVGVSRATIYRYLRPDGTPKGSGGGDPCGRKLRKETAVETSNRAV